ncbi:MAG: AAA family ATPase [Lentisphaerae bacterium]|nr:AAA family ATPase [Lentisphaerota bacterium]MBT4818031.1 AAA family ATPase [Lentisphaerota bacterium]MBT5607596.1 AAA family ATPase [Lentisphaerota bacterium]MBT7056879.1 AAA family ATPase [Lentisphaerota bacterium]MBT7845217.1 AAA family ATPase [Lentisphaerota bacterium]
MPTLLDHLQKAVQGRSPLIYLYSPEENRLLDGVRALADTFPEALPVYVWSCVQGFSGLGSAGDTKAPVDALRAVLASDTRGIFVMRDLHPFLSEPDVIRALRECYYAFREDPDRMVVVMAPELVMPESLKKEIYLIEVLPPGDDQILAEILRVRESYGVAAFAEDVLDEMVLACKGMTVAEIGHVLHRISRTDLSVKDDILEEIFSEKEMIVKKSGYLEFTPPRWDIDGVGGMDNLKDWLRKRQAVFSRDAVASGVPIPKGLLLMGISGCGKSLGVKIISSLWNVPLFRLDMNLVFSGLYGSPEAAFHSALSTLEAVSPAILWIDEIENGLGMEEDKITIASHIFSAFLTWMQEKPPLVFVAATANRIHALPAEIIRKGRFDQVFFADLPNKKEREEIIRIHLQRNGGDPEDYDVEMLGLLMEDWNGAEIEQAIVSARVDAYSEGRSMVQKDVTRSSSLIVPLSTTMEDQIKGIRSWAFTRATPASKYGSKARTR